MTTVTVAECDPTNNRADMFDNSGPPEKGQCTAATQADEQPAIVCNGILCYVYNKMDIGEGALYWACFFVSAIVSSHITKCIRHVLHTVDEIIKKRWRQQKTAC